MKKVILFAFLASAISITACNTPQQKEKDSVEAAEDSNENVNNGVKEDDSDFMVEAANGGMMEVESGKLAQSNGASQDVKNFGARMVTDHTKASEELKALASSKSVVLPAALGDDEQKHIKDMSGMKGADFDKHYMKMMVNDHDKTVRMFEDAARNANDTEVRAWASKTLPVLKEHQTAAKSIHDKLR